MKMKHLWEKKFRKIRIMYKEDSWQYRDGRVGEIFECDTHIADAVYLFNIKDTRLETAVRGIHINTFYRMRTAVKQLGKSMLEPYFLIAAIFSSELRIKS